MDKTTIEHIQKQAVIVGASKTHTKEDIMALYHLGIQDFGENKVQEWLSKYDEKDPFNWHFIGHLQTNKVKEIVKRNCMIQSIDSLKLATAIHMEAMKQNKQVCGLVELNLTSDAYKTGMDYDTFIRDFNAIYELDYLNIQGIMAMGDYDVSACEKTFQEVYRIFSQIQKTHSKCQILSMGMSQDYHIALACGSNMVRLGRILFGKR